LKAMFKAHAEVYERSGGRIGAWLGLPTLLLSVTGRKSGKTYATPLVYFEDGDSYVVVGSDGAAKRDPQWWKNLRIDPNCEVRVGRKKLSAKASLASGANRERLWENGEPDVVEIPDADRSHASGRGADAAGRMSPGENRGRSVYRRWVAVPYPGIRIMAGGFANSGT
ncbi:MAG: nitroreductase/quinone reductase family protein, partial [Polyangiales bacterium]